MPSFDFPHGTPVGERFSPLDLDRTVIAIPLLKQIQEELRIIEEFNLRFPDAARSHNVAILLGRRDSAGLDAAQARITEMAARAASLALKASTERLKRASAESRSAETKYNRSLQTAIAHQEIGQRIEDKFGVVCLASLHSAVIRRLEALNDRMDPSIKPIQRILPKRFEVMIDLNLEHPGGRGAARKWVFDNIEAAKRQAGVRDAGQNVHFEKSRTSNQYIFACLEARAIQMLVQLDIDHAKAKAEKRREPVSRHLSHLAGFRGFQLHRKIDCYGQGRCRPEVIRSPRCRDHLGRFGLGNRWESSSLSTIQQRRSEFFLA